MATARSVQKPFYMAAITAIVIALRVTGLLSIFVTKTIDHSIIRIRSAMLSH